MAAEYLKKVIYDGAGECCRRIVITAPTLPPDELKRLRAETRRLAEEMVWEVIEKKDLNAEEYIVNLF